MVKIYNSRMIVNIIGKVKLKNSNSIKEFFNRDEAIRSKFGREYFQMVIDEHQSILDKDYLPYPKNRPSFYRFDVFYYREGKVVLHKRSAYFKINSNWKLIARDKRTFID